MDNTDLFYLAEVSDNWPSLVYRAMNFSCSIKGAKISCPDIGYQFDRACTVHRLAICM